MIEQMLTVPPYGLGARRIADMERKAADLRSRARQCRDLADSALSDAGKETLSELAFSFQSEANQLERILAASRESEISSAV